MTSTTELNPDLQMDGKTAATLDISAEETIWEKLTSCRWMLAYIGCFCFALLFGIRTSMSIAVICMIKTDNMTALEEQSGSQCSIINNINMSGNQLSINKGGDIEWDKSTQGWVLSSYFYGYILTQIPSGYLSGRFGGKRVMLIGMLTYGVSTILFPLAARINMEKHTDGAIVSAALRFISGLASGAIHPAMQNLWGKWAPLYERSRLNAVSLSGSMIGNVFVLGVGGFLCEWKDFDNGWPSLFYIPGGLCIIFCLLWAFIVYDSPMDHPRISNKEKNYIVSSLKGIELTKNTSVPWMTLFSSRAVWAVVIAHVCSNFGDYTLATKLPAYMKEVMGFEIVSNGLYSILPYIASFIVANTASNMIDMLRNRKLVSTTRGRKLAMTIAFIIPAGMLAAIGNISCSQYYLAITLLTLAIGFTAFETSGYYVNAQDIASRYAGEIFGISNTFATIPGMVAPLLINYMTTQSTREEWQIVFYVWAGIYCFGAIFYLIFASGEPQPWSHVTTELKENDNNDNSDREDEDVI